MAALIAGCETEPLIPNPGNELCEYDVSVPLPKSLSNQNFTDCGIGPDAPLPSGSCHVGEGPCEVGHSRECTVGQAPRGECSPCDAWICTCVEGRFSCWLELPGASPCHDPNEDGGVAPGGANCDG